MFGNKRKAATPGGATAKLEGTSKADGRDVRVEFEVPENSAAQVLVMRTWWYRDAYRRLTLLAMALALMVVIEGAVIAYLGVNKPLPRYVGLDATGRAIPLQPLSYAYPDALVAQWVTRAMTELYTYNYVDYQKRFNVAHRGLMTNSGFNSYMGSVKREKTFEAIEQLRYVVSSSVPEVPVVLKRETRNGQVRWQVQAKVLVRYDSINSRTAKPQILIVDTFVVRVPENVETGGLQIERIVASLARS